MTQRRNGISRLKNSSIFGTVRRLLLSNQQKDVAGPVRPPPAAQDNKLLAIEELEQQLSFLDGYLFREMASMLRLGGLGAKGLYSFYEARIEHERSALSGYDRILYSYILAKFHRGDRQIVHAGIGLGTLASALAQGGFTVAGIEADAGRFEAATRLRSALLDAWPEAADRYMLLFGEFPRVLASSDWVTAKSVLVFTNCGASWSDRLTADAIALFPEFGDVILDSRLFGRVREAPEERDALLCQIKAQGLIATPIPGMTELAAYYYHLRPQDTRQ